MGLYLYTFVVNPNTFEKYFNQKKDKKLICYQTTAAKAIKSLIEKISEVVINSSVDRKTKMMTSSLQKEARDKIERSLSGIFYLPVNRTLRKDPDFRLAKISYLKQVQNELNVKEMKDYFHERMMQVLIQFRFNSFGRAWSEEIIILSPTSPGELSNCSELVVEAGFPTEKMAKQYYLLHEKEKQFNAPLKPEFESDELIYLDPKATMAEPIISTMMLKLWSFFRNLVLEKQVMYVDIDLNSHGKGKTVINCNNRDCFSEVWQRIHDYIQEGNNQDEQACAITNTENGEIEVNCLIPDDLLGSVEHAETILSKSELLKICTSGNVNHEFEKAANEDYIKIAGQRILLNEQRQKTLDYLEENSLELCQSFMNFKISMLYRAKQHRKKTVGYLFEELLDIDFVDSTHPDKVVTAITKLQKKMKKIHHVKGKAFFDLMVALSKFLDESIIKFKFGNLGKDYA